jgi:cellulose synthase/poly-beta-1,6-N-acetylglucosamine synthase-like glycosyltransferase
MNSAASEAEAPRVDIIVSALNEVQYIGRCLAAALAQDYPRNLLRVTFVDGGSTDRTVEVARKLALEDSRLTVVADRGRLNLPEALNVGLSLATGDIAIKVDAHGYPELDYVRQAVNALEQCRADVAAVGGRPEQEGETAWGRAVARARTSRFGTGGSEYAGKSRREFVDTVQCAAYRRNILDRVGHFDPNAMFGEDDELNWRLREAGYRLLLDTAIRFHYVTRPSLAAVYRQYHNYGRAKVGVASAHPKFVRLWHLTPPAAVAIWSLLLARATRSRSARRAAGVSAAAYVVAAGFAAASSPGPKDPASLARVCACFAAIHVGYGIGMLRGLAGRIVRH